MRDFNGYQFLRTDKRATFILLFLRLYIGYTWLAAGIGKVFGQSFNASGFLKGAIAQASGDHPAAKLVGRFSSTFCPSKRRPI